MPVVVPALGGDDLFLSLSYQWTHNATLESEAPNNCFHGRSWFRCTRMTEYATPYPTWTESRCHLIASRSEVSAVSAIFNFDILCRRTQANVWSRGRVPWRERVCVCVVIPYVMWITPCVCVSKMHFEVLSLSKYFIALWRNISPH